MPHTYLTLSSVDQVNRVLQSHNYSVWARLGDRQDWQVYDLTGVQHREGELWVNVGEWHYQRGYLNEEWKKPAFVYMKHQCDGCHYPPNMCCLQPSNFGTSDYERDYGPDSDASIMDSDEYIEAEQRLHDWPFGVEPRTVVLEESAT